MPAPSRLFQICYRPFALIFALAAANSATAGIPATADSYVDSTYSSVNFGDAPYLQIGGTTRTFIQFSLTSLPSGFAASRVNLVVWVNRVITGGLVNVKLLSGSWTESTITNSAQPGISSGWSTTATMSDGSQFVSIDVTTPFNAAVTSGTLGLEFDSSAAVVYLDSKEGVTTSHAASLEIIGNPLSVIQGRGNTTVVQLADSTSSPTSGNVAVFDANGNVKDGGALPSGRPTLQVNGTANGSQSLLNLTAGSNITLTDSGTGSVTIAASGSGSGAVTQIAQTVLSSAASTMSFSSISGSYSNLRLEIMARCTAALAADDIYMQFNGDTAAHYTRQSIAVRATSSYLTSAASVAKAPLTAIACGNATAGFAGSATIRVPAYSASTYYKSAISVGGWLDTFSPAMAQITTYYSWSSTSAISSIVLGLATSGNTFAAGTIVTLYGEQ